MELAKLLDIRPGVTAAVGSGGKTTLLRTLGEELARAGHTVLLCTTTKIFPFDGLPCARTEEELEKLRRKHRLLCAGMPFLGFLRSSFRRTFAESCVCHHPRGCSTQGS